MERYANALRDQLPTINHQLEISEFAFSIPEVLFSGRKKFFWRFGVYPFLAQLKQGNVNHIIDHSYARAIKYFDAKKTVITCHDLIPLDYENDQQALEIFKKTISYLPKAAKIIAVSKATKQDLVDKLNINPEKVVVVYEGVDEKFKVQSSKFKEMSNAQVDLCKLFNLPENHKIILHVGNSLEYKNMEGLIGAFSEAYKKDKNIILVKVGKFTESQLKLILKLKMKSEVEIFERPGLSDTELVSMYNLAYVTCFPSYKEGFGFPVLESMACGTPVVCSNTSSLPEVGGKAAIYVDPNDFESIAQGLLKVLNFSDSEYQNKVAQGIKQASQFIWQQAAKETFSVYSSLA